MIPAPAKYGQFSPHADQVYDAICKLLSERGDQVDWTVFEKADWQLMAQMAKSEGVAPLLYWYFKGGYWLVAVPAKLQAWLKQSYYQTAARNALLFSQADHILGILSDVSIPVIVLKGGALAQMLYPDPALRPMTDFDLLVPHQDLQAAISIVQVAGYQEVFPEHRGMANWLRGAFDHHAHMVGGEGQSVQVEIHWTLIAGEADPRAPSLDWFWSRCRPWQAATNGDQIFVLDPTAQLLYAAAHLFLQHYENLRRLIWYYDLHLIISQWGDDLDWDVLLEQSVALGWQAALHGALVGVCDCMGTILPEGFLERLAITVDEHTQQLMSIKTQRIGSRTLDNWRNLGTYPWHLRFKLFLALLFPRPAYICYRYRPRPVWLWPLYYPYRWWDMLVDVVKTLLTGSGRTRKTK